MRRHHGQKWLLISIALVTFFGITIAIFIQCIQKSITAERASWYGNIRSVEKYVWFQSDSTALDFTFQYPNNWVLTRVKTFEGYHSVAVRGAVTIAFTKSDKNSPDWYPAAGAGTVSNYVKQDIMKQKKYSEEDPDELVVGSSKKRKRLVLRREFRLNFNQKAKLDGYSAQHYSYSEMRWRLVGGKPKSAWFIKEAIVTKKGRQFYAIESWFAESDYQKYRPVFLKARNTFKFKEYSFFDVIAIYIRGTIRSGYRSIIHFIEPPPRV